MKRILSGFAILLLLPLLLCGQGPTQTTISDTLYNLDGSAVSANIQIRNPFTFTAADGTVVPKNSVVTVIVRNGVLSVSLIPNLGSTPGASYYLASYTGLGTTSWVEIWIVPQSATAVNLASVRAAGPVTAFYSIPFAQLVPPPGCKIHQFPEWLAPGWTCSSSTGAGTVTSVGLTAPAWLTVSGSPVSTSGTLGLAPTTGQTPHQVIGTCGAATSFGPCSLTAADIPQLSYSSLSGLPALPANTIFISHEWLTSYNSITGAFGQTQPQFSDVSGSLSSSQFGPLTADVTTTGYVATVVGLRSIALPTLAASSGFLYDSNGTLLLTTSASNLTAGTLPHAQLPSLVSGDIPNNAANTSGSAASLSSLLACAMFPALSGDINTVAGHCATTLATVNSDVGTFTNTNITVNAKGQVTSAANGSTVSSVVWQNQGSPIGTPTTINCSTNLVCSYAGGTVTVVASSSVGTAYSALTASVNSSAGTFAASGNTWDYSAASAFKVPTVGLLFPGSTSGAVTITAPAIAGSRAIAWPVGNGTVAVSAASPLAESAAGQISCPGCATTTNGGALSGSSPVTVSAAGLIACPGCATTTNGGPLTGVSPIVVSVEGAISCPTCGVSGGSVSSVGLSSNLAFLTVANSPITSSGTITLNGTTGLTGNQVVATPNGSPGPVGLRNLVGADIPAINLAASGNGGVTGNLPYSQLSGAPTIYYQTLQVNGSGQTQELTSNLVAGTNMTITPSIVGGVTTLTFTASTTASTAWSSLTAATNSNAGPFIATGNAWDFSAASAFTLPKVGAIFPGSTSGNITVIATAIAGSNTITLPAATGTFAISASSPITLSATGGIGCPSCNVSNATVSSFSAGTLSPLFTTSVATSTTTPSLTFSLSSAGAYTVFGNATGSAAVPGFTSNPAVSSLILEGSSSGSATITVSATGGILALPSGTTATNMSLTTPALGVATATSINGTTIPSSVTLAYLGAAAQTFTNGITAPTFTSTTSTGTAPFTVASTTNVPNLNASSLNGATFASPGAIGGSTAAAANFTTIGATGNVTLSGLLTTGTIANALCTDSGGHVIAHASADCYPFGTGTQYALVDWATTTTPGSIIGNVSGQSLVAANGAAPGFSSPGILDSSTSPVITTPYLIRCDSSTALLDRAHIIRAQTGASVITVPLSSATGCTGGFYVGLLDDGAGTLTVNRTSADTFSIFDGSTNTDGATSFTLTNGQHAVLSQGASGIWEVRKTMGGTSGSASGDLSGTYPSPTVVKIEGAAIPTSATVIATNSSKQLISATVQGNGTKVQLSTGSTTPNDCAKYDANGNVVDAGGVCGSGGSGSGTATLGTGAISSGSCASVVSVSATGVTTTSPINTSFAADPTSTTGYIPSISGMLTILSYPTAGYVNFKVCNNTASSITPGAAITLNWNVGTSHLIASGTSALATSAISSGTCASVMTASAPNVQTTDAITTSFNGDPTAVTGYSPSSNGMLTIIPYPTSSYVNFKVCNNTASSITPGAITLNYVVTR